METTNNAAIRLAADIALDLADRNEHVVAGEGLIPQCLSCEGAGVDGDDDCGRCNGTGRATCECGEPSIRYESFRTLVHGDGGAIVMGTCRTPLCLRCCRQTVGLVGPLTGYEPDPDAAPGRLFDSRCMVAGGYDTAAELEVA